MSAPTAPQGLLRVGDVAGDRRADVLHLLLQVGGLRLGHLLLGSSRDSPPSLAHWGHNRSEGVEAGGLAGKSCPQGGGRAARAPGCIVQRFGNKERRLTLLSKEMYPHTLKHHGQEAAGSSSGFARQVKASRRPSGPARMRRGCVGQRNYQNRTRHAFYCLGWLGLMRRAASHGGQLALQNDSALNRLPSREASAATRVEPPN